MLIDFSRRTAYQTPSKILAPDILKDTTLASTTKTSWNKKTTPDKRDIARYLKAFFKRISYQRLKSFQASVSFLYLLKTSPHLVGNKAKGRTSKWVLQENAQNFPKNDHLTCFIFLSHSFWDTPFWLTTDDL